MVNDALPLNEALEGQDGPLLVFFPRLTIRDVARLVRQVEPKQRWRTLVKKLGHYLGNLGIAFTQLAAHPGWWRRPVIEDVHVALLVPKSGHWPPGQGWLLVESTYPAGVEIKDPAPKLAGFHGVATVVPLTWPSEALALDRLLAWVHEVEGLAYDSEGAIASPLDLNLDAEGEFCSGVGVNALQVLEHLPEYVLRQVHRTGQLRKVRLRPGDFMPVELAMLHGVLDWSRAVNVRAG